MEYLNNSATVSDGVTQIGSSSYFNLASVKGFPYLEYSILQTRYAKQIGWYMGLTLNETFQADGKDIEKYPVKLNPIPTTCLKHAFALMGDIQPGDARPLVIPKFVAPVNMDKAVGKKLVKDAEEAMNTLWWENFGRALQMENAIVSQIFGGCVFGLRSVPWEKYRTIHLKIDRIDPRFFVGFLVPGDPFRLQEAWIVQPMDWKAAEYYGIHAEPNEPCFWLERWTPTTYEITINGKPIIFPDAGEDWKSSGKNKFGFVPFVYIPRSRTAGMYGTNAFDQLTGIVTEMNLRIADFGDAVSSDSHNYGVMVNVNGTPRIISLDGGSLKLIDAGSNASIGATNQNPSITQLRGGSATEPMSKIINQLQILYDRESSVPAVAYGEDEGSQRSGGTLTIRMWPLVSHTNMQRVFWSSGLDWFTRMAMTMMLEIEEGGITKEHIKLRSKQGWFPTLPKDRESVVNEVVNRASTNLGSLEHLLDLLGDVEDVDGEVALIKEWVSFLAETKAKSAVKPEPVGSSGKATGTAQAGQANAKGSNNSSKPSGE